MPADGAALIDDNHECLNLRFAGAAEFKWRLQTPDGTTPFAVKGRFESDDGDVLTDWALAGYGIALKPIFEIAHHLDAGALVPVATATPPEPIQMACLYTHRRHQDPKTRLFMEFATSQIGKTVKTAQSKFA